MSNPDVAMTLDDAVNEVLGNLTGLELRYDPDLDRYRAVVRAINRAMRAVAAAHEWSDYSSLEDVGVAHAGESVIAIRSSLRPRILGDDSVRLARQDGTPVVWAQFLPRESIHKYPSRRGLWVSAERQALRFSRPFHTGEEGLRILVPVMREPKQFILPSQPEGDVGDIVEVPQAVRDQEVDFPYPDLVVAKAMYFYAQSDPVMQPRVQTLDSEYTDLFYALKERDTRFTDAPYLNPFDVPMQGSIFDGSYDDWHHPHSDDRY